MKKIKPTLVLVAFLFLSACERVAPNYYGVLMENCGKNGKSDYSRQQGRVTTAGACTELFQVPAFEQRADFGDRVLHLKAADNTEFSAKPLYSYKAKEDRVVDLVFQNARLGSGDDFMRALEDNVLEPHIYDLIKEESRKYVTDSLMANGGSLRFEEAVQELGIPKERIELWHHEIDGRGEQFMDWECTKSYCEAFAAYFGIPIYFSWKEGGFKREMLRDNSRTAPIHFEIPGGTVLAVGGKLGKKSTRRKFPQVSPDLRVRWCSAYLKIDVMAAAIRNQERFSGIKTLVLSGERGEESSARSKYEVLERDRTDGREGKKKRHVDRWRPIRDWKESEVWDIIQRFSIRVHPAYYLGYNRVSCKWCIFGNKNQFATSYKISPEQGDALVGYEEEFGCTVKRNIPLKDLIASGEAYTSLDAETVLAAISHVYTLSIKIQNWYLPAGAYGESCGPI